MKIKDAIRLALLHSYKQGWLPSGVWGQDSAGHGKGTKGGVLAETQGLKFAHNTILNERPAAWLPYAAAFLKQPALGVMQFADYQHNTYDIMKMIGETCWSSGGRVPMPLVIMTAYGALSGKGALYHSQTLENEMVGLPGWKVVSVSNPNDAASLLVAAIKDPNPVHFSYPRAHSGLPTDSATTKGLAHIDLPGFELLPGEKALMEQANTINEDGKTQWLGYLTPPKNQRDGTWEQVWPEGLEIPEDQLGTAKLRREGDFGVVFSHGRMMPMAWQAAETLSFLTGQEIAVMDMRTLKPVPMDDMAPYIEKSRGRILLLTEATAQNNWMKSLAQDILQDYGWGFETYPQVLCTLDSPVPQAYVMEQQVVPQFSDAFASLCEFFQADQIRQLADKVGKPIEINSKGWFDKADLKALAAPALHYTQVQSPNYQTPINPVKTLARK